MKKIIKIVLCVGLSLAIISITSDAATYTFNFTGKQQSGNSAKFKLTQGKTYTFDHTEDIAVRPNTKAREIQFGNHLTWHRWYGDLDIGGEDVTKTIGNTTDKYITKTYTYSFKKYIDTTSDGFYFNYGAYGASNDYDFTLKVKY